MRTIAKWVVIIWSILSLIAICLSIVLGLGVLAEFNNEYEFLGGTFGLACILGILLLVWFAIAGPALLIYLVSGKKDTTRVEIIDSSSYERKG